METMSLSAAAAASVVQTLFSNLGLISISAAETAAAA